MTFSPAKLILENGCVFSGVVPTTQKSTHYGEIVFTTGMTGYVETLTDPSYYGQIVVFTYPLIGNYGVPKKGAWESQKIQAAGVVLSEVSQDYSHYAATQSFLSWLTAYGVPILTSVDTRELTKTLREKGVMRGAITRTGALHFPPLERNPVAAVTIGKKQIYGRGKKKIIVVDCGMKESILRCLLEFPVAVERVPYTYDYTQDTFDGVLISNGPGDPTVYTETIAILKKAMEKKKPIFGICLGSQLMALAAGAQTYKLPFGHRGQNQPCIETKKTNHCVITSQNHGYAVKENTLPKGWYANYKNLNDGSVEGVAHTALPFFSVQFHPEAAPGPSDTKALFENFYTLL